MLRDTVHAVFGGLYDSLSVNNRVCPFMDSKIFVKLSPKDFVQINQVLGFH